MATKRKSITVRKPNAEGADVVLNSGEFYAYSNGHLVTVTANSQDAWIAARAAYFATVEAETSTVVETVEVVLDDLVAAVDAARVAAAGDARWLNAINTGYDWLLQQERIIFEIAHHELTVPSASTEGRTYRANGSCQCKAFEQHNACWHRAAARLVRRACEHRAAQAVAHVEAGERQRQRDKAYADMMTCFTF